MRKDITIPAEPRATRGKNEARRLRVRNLTPAVLYGAGKDPVAIAVDPKDISKILRSPSGHNTVFNLDVQGVENTPAMIVNTQLDPVKSSLLHTDLQRIDLTHRMRVKVGIHFEGEAKGVKQQGGTLEVVNREIEIECLPDEIPERFNVSVADLMVGGSIRTSEIQMSGSMKLTSPSDMVIVHVVGAKAEAAPVEEGAVAEPEVIKKGKKEEEGAAKPAAKAVAKPAEKPAEKPAAKKK
jgi:large subunit ribosomal protein L25